MSFFRKSVFLFLVLYCQSSYACKSDLKVLIGDANSDRFKNLASRKALGTKYEGSKDPVKAAITYLANIRYELSNALYLRTFRNKDYNNVELANSFFMLSGDQIFDTFRVLTREAVKSFSLVGFREYMRYFGPVFIQSIREQHQLLYTRMIKAYNLGERDDVDLENIYEQLILALVKTIETFDFLAKDDFQVIDFLEGEDYTSFVEEFLPLANTFLEIARQWNNS